MKTTARLVVLFAALVSAGVLAAPPELRWVWLDLNKDETYLAFTYVDATAGRSAKGILAPRGLTATQAKGAVTSPDHTFRLAGEMNTRLLTAEELQALQLPTQPEWYTTFFAPSNARAVETGPKARRPVSR